MTPFFALATINELVLQDLVRRLLDEINARLAAFNVAVEKTERRAGSLLAQDVAEAGARLRAELQSDIDTASLKAAYLVHKVEQAQKRPAMIRWTTLGLSLAVILLISGHSAHSWHAPAWLIPEGLNGKKPIGLWNGMAR